MGTMNLTAPQTVDQFADALVALARLPVHYGSHILWEMATKYPELKVLKLHSTMCGDRMVIRWQGDPFWLYEIELRPVKPEQLEGEDSLFMERRTHGTP
jgi:hypothetical protein